MGDDNNAVLGVLNRLKGKIEDKAGKYNCLSNPVDLLKEYSGYLSNKAYVTNPLKKQGELFTAIQKKIMELQDVNNQLNEEKEMVTEDVAMGIGTKLVIAGSVLLVLGIAVAFWAEEEKKKKTKEFSGSKSHTLPPPNYQPHHLLLIVPADQLAGFSKGQAVTKNQIEPLIKNVVRVYCYSDADPIGKAIAAGVLCTDDAIDVTSSSRVFLHLSLSASAEIIKERTRNGVINAINPSANAEIKILNLGKPQSPRSTTAFYDL